MLKGRSINRSYITDVEKWICNCPSFLLSRFFLCKHLIQRSQFEITPKFFYHQIQRQGKYPFLVLQGNITNITPDNSIIENRKNAHNGKFIK